MKLNIIQLGLADFRSNWNYVYIRSLVYHASSISSFGNKIKMHSLLRQSISFASTFTRTWNIALFFTIRGTEGSFSIPSTYLKHFILWCTAKTFLFYYSLITAAALISSTQFCLFEDSLEECLCVGGCWISISCGQNL